MVLKFSRTALVLIEEISPMPKSSRFESPEQQPSPALHAGSAGTAVLDAPPAADTGLSTRRKKSRGSQTSSLPHTFHAVPYDDSHGANHQAELFYLQKQIQQQTQMIFIMEDGARIQGVIEWYDRYSIKVRGKSRILIYKSAIKYLYKAGEFGSAPGE
jgi:sRNA-binding regulator protein Hfq